MTERIIPESEEKKPWVRTLRRESGLIEHICEHGVGHPALGSVMFMTEMSGDDGWGVHGCDGCCQTPEWRLADAVEGLRIANRLLADQLKRNRIYAARELQRGIAEMEEKKHEETTREESSEDAVAVP